MADELHEVMTAVGPRLRALRHQQQLTLSDLATATGISVSTLSRLESGQRRPNLELLLPLARVHRVPLDELVGAPATGDPRIHPRPITRYGMTILPLSRRTDGLQAFKHVMPAATGHHEPDPQVHEGYGWIYVLSGHLRLVLGEHDLTLAGGEAAEFDTRAPHWFGQPRTRPGRISHPVRPPRRTHARTCPTRTVTAPHLRRGACLQRAGPGQR